MKLVRIFNRLKRPAGVITWRYLTGTTDLMIKQHRRALLYVPREKSKFIYLNFYLLQQLMWWSYYGWRAFFKVWKRRANWHTDLNDWQIFENLFYLTFLYTIPPSYYFRFKLYLYTKEQWLQFAYDHEVPKWHSALSTNVSVNSQQYLSSKFLFAEKSTINDIAVIPTINFIKKATVAEESDIFQKKSYFFKPNQENQSRGCFALYYYSKTDSYELKPENNNKSYKKPNEIAKQINLYFLKYNYLQQPLLENHPTITALFKTKRLITIRLITMTNNNCTPQPISAIIEVPYIKDRRFYKLIRVDVNTGKLSNRYLEHHLMNIDEEHIEWLEQVAEKIIPQWKSLILVAQKAHCLCLDVHSIGWDIAITQIGPIIIEGNTGFGISKHQMDLGIFSELFNPIHQMLRYSSNKK